jgi:inner membrane protein
MTATTHQMAALVAALWVVTSYEVPPVGLGGGALAAVAVMLGALTPDLDQPTANMWKKMLGARTLGKIFQKFSGGHRHMTHSLVGIVAIGWLLRYSIEQGLNPAWQAGALRAWWAYMIGYISHPIADTLTDMGVPWLWPLNWNIKIPPGPEEVRVTTGSWVEMVLVRGGLLVAAGILISGQREELLQWLGWR